MINPSELSICSFTGQIRKLTSRDQNRDSTYKQFGNSYRRVNKSCQEIVESKQRRAKYLTSVSSVCPHKLKSWQRVAHLTVGSLVASLA